jgi:hypothetical protein
MYDALAAAVLKGQKVTAARVTEIKALKEMDVREVVPFA